MLAQRSTVRSMDNDDTAIARDAEVARLHPDAVRKQVRATLPARVVLRGVEREEGDERIPLIGKTHLTAAVDARGVHFFAGADPVQDAGSIDATDVAAVGTGTEINPPFSQRVLRLSVAGVGTHPLDVDLELFEFDGGSLQPVSDFDDEVTSWAALLGRR